MKLPDMSKKELGKWGEEYAAAYLRENKILILAMNYYSPYGEIDIIGKESDMIVFFEIKTRRTMTFGKPEISVGFYKKKHLVDSVFYYLQENDQLEEKWRIDVISINTGTSVQVEWFKYAIST